MRCQRYYPECRKGAVVELRFKGMSFLLMCRYCKDRRLEQYSELVKYQKNNRFEDAPIESQSEFRDHKTNEPKV